METTTRTSKIVEVPKKLEKVVRAIFGDETGKVFERSLDISAKYNRLSANTFVGKAEIYCLMDTVSYLIFVFNFDNQGRLNGQIKMVFYEAIMGTSKTLKEVNFKHTDLSDVLDKYRRRQLKLQEEKLKQERKQRGYEIVDTHFGR